MMKKPIVKLSAESQSLFTESVAEYIFGDLMTLSTVESKHFQGMIKVISGGSYEPPKRRYFTDTLLPRMMENCAKEIRNEVETICGIGLTTDSWTSCATENYITYTAHYITKE